MSATVMPIKSDFDRANEHYFVVEMPIRMTGAELAQLTTEAHRIKDRSKNGSIFSYGSVRVSVARQEAINIIKKRRHRENVIGSSMFGDPAWDILLELFVCRVDRRRMKVTAAALAGGVAATTGGRYLNVLLDEGLLEKQVAATDLRIQYVSLSDDGYEKMLDVLCEFSTMN